MFVFFSDPNRILTEISGVKSRSGSRQKCLQLFPLYGALLLAEAEVMMVFEVVVVVLVVLVEVTERRLFAKGGERLISRLLSAFKYLCVRDRVHAGHVEVAAVVRALTPVGGHEARHPAAVRVAQGFTLLRAVREKVGTCGGRGGTGEDRGKWSPSLASTQRVHKRYKVPLSWELLQKVKHLLVTKF